jgi:hypothetical protein
MSRLTDAAGPNPLLWIICGRSRVAAVTKARVLVFYSDAGGSTDSLTLRDDELWRIYQQGFDYTGEVVQQLPPPTPERVPVVDVGCGRHGQHPVDGERLARLIGHARRVDAEDLAPRA